MLSHDHYLPDWNVSIDPLLDAVMLGDEAAVRKALASGADVNVVSMDGTNVLTALLMATSEKGSDASDASNMSTTRLNILNTLVSHPDISLYTLNVTQSSMSGVKAITPLGLAAILNRSAAVKVLLETCMGLIYVDFPDDVGGTPLMYACRNGSLDVVQNLLAHGARPDIRDAQFRTSVVYALSHPRALWHCEDALRRHRAREVLMHHNKRNICESVQHNADYFTEFPTIPPIHICSRDSDFTRTLLDSIFSSQSQSVKSLLFPSVNNLAKTAPPPPSYLINSRDSHGWSPIHHCALAAQPSIEIIDLLYLAGADISLSTAVELYTPLHCLALSSSRPRDPIDALMLYSFTVHLIRDLKAPFAAQDANGETCIHIAAEHGDCVDVLLAFLDCDAKSTVRELRNSRGLLASEVAKPKFMGAFGVETARPDSAASMLTIKPKKSSKSLKSVSSYSSFVSVTAPYDYIPVIPSEYPVSPDAGVFQDFQHVLQNLRYISQSLSTAFGVDDLDALEDLLVATLDMGTILLRRAKDPIDRASDELQKVQASVGRVSGLVNVVSRNVEDKLEVRTGDQWLDSTVRSRRQMRDSGSSGLTLVSQFSSTSKSVSGSTKVGSTSDISTISEGESWDHMAVNGAKKLKRWFKKKLGSDTTASCSSKKAKSNPAEWEGSKGLVLRSSDRILNAASRDLVGIEESMTMADQHIATSYHFISKAETIFSQAIRNRQVAIYNEKCRQLDPNYLDPTLFTLPYDSPPSSPVDPDIFDDELLKSFKQHLTTRVDVQVEGARGEIEKANVWLRIVKDVVRGLNERTSV